MNNDETHSKTKKRSNIIVRWLTDFRTALTDNNGWKLCSKIIAGIFIFIGCYITLLTYQDSVKSEYYKRIEWEYQNIIRDLNNDNKWMRIDSLSRVPAFFNRQATQSTLWGKSHYRTPIFIEPLRGQLNRFLHGNDDSQMLSDSESQMFINAIRALGANGWYFSKILENKELSGDLSWIWANPPSDVNNRSVQILHGLFVNVKMQGVDLMGYNLSKCLLKSSTLKNFNMTKCRLNEADIRNTKFINTDFYNAQLRNCKAQNASFQLCKLESCSMNSAKLSGATFKNTYISRVDFSPTLIQGDSQKQFADLSRASFIDCNITDIDFTHANMFGVRFVGSDTGKEMFLGASHSNFENVELESSTMDGVCLEECNFKNASLIGVSAKAARFSFSHFEGADLDKADFSNSDLSDVTGFDIAAILSGRGIKSCSTDLGTYDFNNKTKKYKI